MILDYLIKNKEITNLSNFKTIAKTSYYFEINNRQDIDKLFDIYNFSVENHLKILFIWWWTNLLFAFNNFDWIIIKNSLLWWNYSNKTKILESNSNELISDIAKKLFNDGQVLWKRFIWLPWSIWWAVFWNAGCFWLEIENNFVEAEVLDIKTGTIYIFNKLQMEFEYRNSIVKKMWRYFIISIKFDLSKKIEKYHSDIDNLYFREFKQPKGYSCGSFFKNPSKENSAWSLIEKVWLRWYKLWWAYFSDLHANFLLNDWSASYNDLLKLIDLAKNKVKMDFNIDLIPEVRIVYN